jgi:hypothetical protein
MTFRKGKKTQPDAAIQAKGRLRKQAERSGFQPREL